MYLKSKRNPSMYYRSITALVLGLCSALNALSATPSMDELWQIIQQQQHTIEALQVRLDAADQRMAQTEEAVEVTADAVETVTAGDASAVRARRTVIGGYGELHYNNLDERNTATGDVAARGRTDFHRFVLYFGHQFTDDIRFFSELEVEHALVEEGEPGAVELEQAWIEMQLTEQHHLRAGVDILPIGIINPTHEPDTFYGVERNRVESEIIPATWWEAGLGAGGELSPGWNYDLVLHSGLRVPISGSSSFRPRSGRLEVAEAEDQDLALTGRLRYTGTPGLEIGVSAQYQSDITGTADRYDIDATLLEAHVDYKHSSGFGLRALYARWDLGNDDGLDPAAVGAGTLDGWYVEPAYRFRIADQRWSEVGVFARYSRWNEGNGLDGAAFRYEDFEQVTVGFNWWPHSNLSFKFDAQWEHAAGPVSALFDGINLGLGYQF